MTNTTPISPNSIAFSRLKTFVESSDAGYAFSAYIERINKSPTLVAAINDWATSEPNKTITIDSTPDGAITKYVAAERSLKIAQIQLLSPTYLVRVLAHEIYGHDRTRDVILNATNPNNELYAGREPGEVRGLVKEGCFVAEYLGYIAEYRIGQEIGFDATGFLGIQNRIREAIGMAEANFPQASKDVVDLAAARFLAKNYASNDVSHLEQCKSWADQVIQQRSGTPVAQMVFQMDNDGNSEVALNTPSFQQRISNDQSYTVIPGPQNESIVETWLDGVLIQFYVVPTAQGSFNLTGVASINGNSQVSVPTWLQSIGGVEAYVERLIPNAGFLLSSNPDQIGTLRTLIENLTPFSLDGPIEGQPASGQPELLQDMPELGLSVTRQEVTDARGPSVILRVLDSTGEVKNTLTARPGGEPGLWDAELTLHGLTSLVSGQPEDAVLRVQVQVQGARLEDVRLTRILGLGDASAPAANPEAQVLDDFLSGLGLNAIDLLLQPGLKFAQLTCLATGATSADAYGFLPLAGAQATPATPYNNPRDHGLGALQGLFDALGSHNLLGVAATAFSIMDHNNRTVSGDDGLAGIASTLGVVNGVATAGTSLHSLLNALQRGDMLGIANSGLQVAQQVAQLYNSSLLGELNFRGDVNALDSLAQWGDEQAQAFLDQLQTSNNAVGALGTAASVVGILYSLSKGDVAGTASSVAALAGFPMVAAVVSMVNLFIGMERDPQGQAAWVNRADASGHLLLQAVNIGHWERDGGDAQILGLASQVAAQLNQVATAQPGMGFIAQRLGHLEVDGNQIHVVTPTPLDAGTLEHMVYDSLGRLIAFGQQTAGGDVVLGRQTTLHKWNLLTPVEYLLAAADANQAYAPQWMVQTVQRQADRGDARAGWTTHQRAAAAGQLLSEDDPASIQKQEHETTGRCGLKTCLAKKWRFEHRSSRAARPPRGKALPSHQRFTKARA